MAIFRQRYKQDGKTLFSKNWYVRFNDYRDKKKEIRIKGFSDRRATEQLERKIQALISIRVAGENLTSDFKLWLNGLSEYLRQRLLTIGLLFPEDMVRVKLISEHLEDYKRYHHARGTVLAHAKQVLSRCKRVFKVCKIVRLDDIDPQKITLCIGQFRDEGMSAATCNQYLRSVKSFCNWLVKNKVWTENPLKFIKPRNEAVDRRHDRRALSSEEMGRLLQVTIDSTETIHGMNGEDRYFLYLLTMETGLRWSELYSLTKASFSLGSNPPTVTVEASFSKHRREDVLPLRVELAEKLALYLNDKAKDERAFPMWQKRGAKMLRHDLEKAGIPYKTADGYADFHALRHSFLTSLAMNGVHPKLAQMLARHSDISLTMNLYTHADVVQKAAALENLPKLG